MNEQERATQDRAGAQKAAEKQPASSLIPELAYYPGAGKHGQKLNPVFQLIPYAEACIEIVRLLNDRAAMLYKRLVEVCKEPECKAIRTRFIAEAWRFPYDRWCLLEKVQREGATQSVADTMNPDNEPIPPAIQSVMEDFVLYGFNRPDDIRNRLPKVLLVRDDLCNATLFIALLQSTFMDSLELSEQDYGRVRDGSVSDLLGSNPTTRAERRRKAKIIETFKKLNCGAVSKQTLLHGAELWYLSRVDPGQEVLVCNNIFNTISFILEQPTLSHWIEPYDHATGYPR